jgi:hypothetical protein
MCDGSDACWAGDGPSLVVEADSDKGALEAPAEVAEGGETILVSATEADLSEMDFGVAIDEVAVVFVLTIWLLDTVEL